MIQKLRIKNFRSIKDSKDMVFSNLNVIVGPNNSGKSSLLYSVLLLKQTLLDDDPRSSLVTTGPHIDLGSYLDIIRGHDSEEKLEVQFSLKTTASAFIPFGGVRLSFAEMAPFTECRVVLRFNKEKNTVDVSSFELSDANNKISFKGSPDENQWTHKGISTELAAHLGVDFEHFLPVIGARGNQPKNKEIRNQCVEEFLNSRMRIRAITDWFDGVRYIGPIRERIPRYGVLGTMPFSGLGPSGQNLMRVLSEAIKISPSKRSLIQELNHWLDKKFKILKNVRIIDIDQEKTIKSLVADDPRGKRDINLAATGSGLSQIVPVIVQTVLTPKNRTIIIEQPEIHLHPKAQADLGDLFVEYSKKGRQIIVETHSEHLLLRIRRRIAEKKLPPELVKIFFVNQRAGETKVRALNLQDNGHFTKWPRGFFEESYNEAMAIAKTQLQ